MGAVTRRALFGTGAGLALAGSAAVSPRPAKGIRSGDTLCPDAELIRLCAEFFRVDTSVEAVPDDDALSLVALVGFRGGGFE